MITLPDYAALLHLHEQETEFPIIPACLITFFHYRPEVTVTIPVAVKWGERWVKTSCTSAAVLGRFKRLATKYSTWLKIVDGGSLRVSGMISLSDPRSSSHKLNQTIALLCLERLDTCLPAQYATAQLWDSQENLLKQQHEHQDTSTLLRAKQAENDRLLKVTKDILEKQYLARRAHLTEQLEELDSSWNTPLKELTKDLEEQLNNWTTKNCSESMNESAKETDDDTGAFTDKSISKAQRPVAEVSQMTETKSVTAVASGVPVPKRESATSKGGNRLTRSLRIKIRKEWQQDTENAKDRILLAQMTEEHVRCRCAPMLRHIFSQILATFA